MNSALKYLALMNSALKYSALKYSLGLHGSLNERTVFPRTAQVVRMREKHRYPYVNEQTWSLHNLTQAIYGTKGQALKTRHCGIGRMGQTVWTNRTITTGQE